MRGCVTRFALALLLHIRTGVNRRVALVLEALIIPGGLLALMAAAVVRAVARSRTGRRAWVRMAGFWRRTVSPLETVPKAA